MTRNTPSPVMSKSKYMIGGVAVGAAAGFISQIRMLFGKVFSLFIVRIDIESYQLSEAFKRMLVSEFRCSPLGKKNYAGGTDYVRPEQRNMLVAMEEIPEESTIWWRNFRPLIISCSGSDISMIFIRGIYKRDLLIQEAVDLFNNNNDGDDWKRIDRFRVRRKTGNIGRQVTSRNPGQGESDAEMAGIRESCDKMVSRPIRWTRDELGLPKPVSPMSFLSLSEEITATVQEALIWRNSEKWFKSKTVPWKRGLLLQGEPGTGKTAFVRALGQELNMPIYSFDLATMSNQDFIEAWEQIMGYTPCIALFEDIDAVFEGRTNVAARGFENGLTFDCLLNQMDGVENTDGVFIIVTTNDISKIDPAIGTSSVDGDASRPGRIDKTLEFSHLSEAGKLKLANRLLGDFDKKTWRHLLDDSKPLTGAQFQDRCSRLAMSLFWETKDGS